jgi:hypothetical protein
MSRELRLVGIELTGPADVNDALSVDEEDVLARHAQPYVVLRCRYRGSARARENHFERLDLFADALERVEERRSRDDCSSVLVVVEDRDLHRLPERLLDVEAIGRANVLEVDATHRRLEELAESDHVLRILRPDFQIEDVEIRELLEEIPLALHHRLAGERPDVAQTEDSGSVGDDGDEVPLGRVLVSVVRVVLDLEAGKGNARGVG